MPQSREIELSKAISMPGSLMNTTGNALDVRYVAKNETDRISIPQASRYVGLQVYQTDTKTLYVLKDNSTAQGTWEKVAISGLDQDLQAKNITVSQSILPTTNGQQDIGSPDKRFRSIYVDEAYLSTNTLYIGDTPILGTDADTVMIKADPDQSINLKTSGTGTAKITSQSTAEISTSGMNADVVVQATGQGSMVRASATEEVRLEAPTVSLKGDVTISKDLTVDGNVKIKGSTFEVDSTTVTTQDNIIVLNKGEVGSGVTKGSAGIQVDRGDATDYQFIFDESDDMFKVGMSGDLQTVATRPYVDSAVAGKANASHSHNNATTSASGFMSNTDKAKLDGIAANSTKVEKSSTNGNIKINGTETTVYVHPAGTNPHGTTKADVGLGNVPNVATNDQTPTFTTASTLANLTSGEKLSSMLGKVSKAITDLTSHISNRSNPHGVTTSQIGAETPAGAQAKVDAHANNEDVHITAEERELLNEVSEKAPLASPTFTGTPKAPTASAGTNSTQVATTAFVTTAVNNKTSVSGNAGTATKLQTARKIGNASFDGSADITLSQIGAAASSHTHTIANVTGLQSALDEKASASHSHTADDITLGETGNLFDVNSSENLPSCTIDTATGAIVSGSRWKVSHKIPVTPGNEYAMDIGGDLVTVATYTSSDTLVDIEYLDMRYSTITIASTGAYVRLQMSESNNELTMTGNGGGTLGEELNSIKSQLSEKANASHTHSNATSSVAGFMSATDKAKLDGIATGANKITVDSALSSSSTNPVQNKVINTALAGKANSSHTHAISDVTNLQSTLDGKASTSHSHSNATTSAAGFMSSTDKAKLDGIAAGANNYVHPSTHDASMIVESSTKRFVTDSEKSTWNAKASTAVATTSANGLMASADKTKLNSIASGAQVNQNAFSNVTVGSTTIAADSVTDTLTLVAGSNVTITPDATNDKITIAATNTTYGVATGSANGLMSSSDKSKLDGIAAGANNYVHPATHDASMITESSSKRFVSDSEKSTWNAKETTSGSQAKADAALNSAKSYTDTKVAALVNSAPEALDTLGELATAIQENENAYDGLLTTVGSKADKSYVDTELAKKANSSHTHAISDITNLQSSLNAKANLASPALTGTPTAPTASAGTNSTQVATTAFVTTAINNKTSVSGNAGTATKLATARKIGQATFDGTADINLAQIGAASTDHLHEMVEISGLQSALNAKAPLASPALTGTPTAPTASAGTNNTQVATTAFVTTAVNNKTSVSGNAGTATKLQTARTINGTSFDGSANITTANWGTARNLTVGNSTKSVNGSGNVSWSLSEIGAAAASHTHDYTQINSVKSTRINKYADENTSGSLSAMDQLLVNQARANRTAFSPANAITVEYSTDGGSTWSTYSLTDAQKMDIFSMNGAISLSIGGPGSATVTTSMQLRVTVSPTDRYAKVNQFYSWVGTSGHTIVCDIERSTIGAKTTFTKIRENVGVSGWSGPNMINFASGTYGGGENQTSNFYSYRFTFRITAVGSSYPTSKPTVGDLRMYGDTVWTTANSQMSRDYIYSWDRSQNVTFPATVTAPTFSGSLSGNASTASKLAAARTISATGDATGSLTFDGSANASMTLTLANSGATAGSYGPTANATASFGGTIAVPQVTVDAKGRVTSVTSRTITLPANPNSDTKVTNTLATTTKAYITGTTSASTNTGTQVFDTGVYLDTTAGKLVATTFAGSGESLTSLNASNISSGTLNSSRLPESGAMSGTYGQNNAVSNATSFTVPKITIDSKGRVTSAGNITVSIKDASDDIKQTATTEAEERNILLSQFEKPGGQRVAVEYTEGVTVNPSTNTIKASTFKGALSGNANTATTLQTARTINGTSFNGSANITTAQWGTARTLTIGNSAKSVNGSANVSWSLSEIGAASTAVATTSANGLMSASDKSKLDGISDITTITKTLSLTTEWQDTGITGSNLATGSYILQMNTPTDGTGNYWSEMFTGTMSWYSGATNSTDADEIVLHKAGHASGGGMIYLRTIRSASSGYLKLQIAASAAVSNMALTFKFRKLI